MEFFPLTNQHAEELLRNGALGSHRCPDIVVPANDYVPRLIHHDSYLIRRRNLGEFYHSIAGARRVPVVRGHHISSADRARCVREEPRIDAVRMEGMAAFGQQAEHLVVLELVERDRALECFFSLRLEALHEIVAEHWEAFNR